MKKRKNGQDFSLLSNSSEDKTSIAKRKASSDDDEFPPHKSCLDIKRKNGHDFSFLSNSAEDYSSDTQGETSSSDDDVLQPKRCLEVIRLNGQDFSLLSDSSDYYSCESRSDMSSSDDDEGQKAKQCLEPLVDTSPLRHLREYRVLWFLGFMTALIMGAAIIAMQITNKGKSASHENNRDIPFSHTMVPTTIPKDETEESHTAPPIKETPSVTDYTPIPTLVPTSISSFSNDLISSDQQTLTPSEIPSMFLQTPTPTMTPTSFPTKEPTKLTTKEPTKKPTGNPTVLPTGIPTVLPTGVPSLIPSVSPSLFSTHPFPSSATWQSVLYRPGNLTTVKLGLLLSEGLDARLVATSGKQVDYADGSLSRKRFHGRPDAGETFVDERPENPGGWIYVSNSEMYQIGTGGVGALTFNKDGNIVDYSMILEGTSMNCGGGRTPWDTWVSCEEIEFDGLIYQVDPTGKRRAQLMTLGSSGGRWESFAFDVRNRERPYFFVTEDHNKGAVRRFTPQKPDWDYPWEMLHGDGLEDYLMVFPNSTNDGGSFEWTRDLKAAKLNAKTFYPQSEGIDVHKNELFLVCKNIKQLFVLDLDRGTYYNRTTVSGLFDGKPDQVKRIVGNSQDILYFTEEQGEISGVHARDSNGRFYSILEGTGIRGETSGLAFSPDAKHMYIAFQTAGKLFDVWRVDGLPFNAKRLDVKYHTAIEKR